MTKPRPLRKTDLIVHFIEHFAARDVKLRRSDAREFLEELHRLCVSQLNDTGEFTLPGLVKFVARDRPARNGRNPRTRETIRIEPRRVATGRIAKQLKDALGYRGRSSSKTTR